MIGIVVVTHGHFGQELLRTAQDIVGRQEAAVGVSMTLDLGLEDLSRALEKAADALAGTDGILFLVDLMGGSPCNTVLLKFREANMEVVTGVNLYMLISAFTHRSQMDLPALAVKVQEDGKKGILLPKRLLAYGKYPLKQES